MSIYDAPVTIPTDVQSYMAARLTGAPAPGPRTSDPLWADAIDTVESAMSSGEVAAPALRAYLAQRIGEHATSGIMATILATAPGAAPAWDPPIPLRAHGDPPRCPIEAQKYTPVHLDTRPPIRYDRDVRRTDPPIRPGPRDRSDPRG